MQLLEMYSGVMLWPVAAGMMQKTCECYVTS
jgi:hypothetical protein